MSDVPGIIYAVKNPAWPTWVKVGRAEGDERDAENIMKRRLYQYNTGDPERGYEALVVEYAACCRTAERFAHDFLEVFCFRGNGEWFQQREEDVAHYIKEAARIARLHPALRSPRYTEVITEIRESLKDDTIQIVTESRRNPRVPDVAGTAQAAHEVIRLLLETMAMPDDRLEAAAEVVLRRLDALGGE